MLACPSLSVFAVPYLGLYLGRFPGSPVFLRGGPNVFLAKPLPEAIGCSAAHRVGGLVVFLCEFFWKVILEACTSFSFEGFVDRVGCRSRPPEGTIAPHQGLTTKPEPGRRRDGPSCERHQDFPSLLVECLLGGRSFCFMAVGCYNR